jgi:CRISPR/Cas system-associated exonuclease Cas4 (RecB family)
MGELINIIQNSVVAMNVEEGKKHSGGKFYPSSCGRCSRAIVYQMSGYPKPEMDARSLLILSNGTSFHERMEAIMGGAGIMIAPELSISSKELNISGRSDAIIKNHLDHETNEVIVTLTDPEGKVVYEGPESEVLIVELKSINQRGFDWITKKQEHKEEHELQLQLYMYLTGIRQGILLYENKNKQELAEFPIKYDQKKVDFVVNKIKTVNKHVEDGTLPPREYVKTDFECRYCEYADICWPKRQTYNLSDIL